MKYVQMIKRRNDEDTVEVLTAQEPEFATWLAGAGKGGAVRVNKGWTAVRLAFSDEESCIHQHVRIPCDDPLSVWTLAQNC
jgi:hypothetical protein